jgi:hypothetical protein
MNTFIRCLVTVVVLLSVAPARSDEQEKTPQEIETLANELVLKLFNPKFQEREAASGELAKLGLGARKAIEEGCKNPNPEIRYRCKLLCRVVRVIDLERRIEELAADKEGLIENTLPLGATYERICGKDEIARKFYIEICKNHLQLLDGAANNPQAAGETFIDLNNKIEKRDAGVFSPETEVAALLLMAADEKVGPSIEEANIRQGKGGDRNYQRLIGILWKPKYDAAMKDGDSGRYFRKLLFAWGKRLPEPLAMSAYLFFVKDLVKRQIVSLERDSDAFEFVADLALSTSAQRLPYHKGEAMAMLAEASISQYDRIAFFEEKLLKDETTLVPVVGFDLNEETSIKVETRACDYALAVCVKLSGQSFQDYGFDVLGSRSDMFGSWLYAGFSKDETRKAAIKKYEEWRKANPIQQD